MSATVTRGCGPADGAAAGGQRFARVEHDVLQIARGERGWPLA